MKYSLPVNALIMKLAENKREAARLMNDRALLRTIIENPEEDEDKRQRAVELQRAYQSQLDFWYDQNSAFDDAIALLMLESVKGVRVHEGLLAVLKMIGELKVEAAKSDGVVSISIELLEEVQKLIEGSQSREHRTRDDCDHSTTQD